MGKARDGHAHSGVGEFTFSKAETLSLKVPPRSTATSPICVDRELDVVPIAQVEARRPGWTRIAISSPLTQIRVCQLLRSVFLEFPAEAPDLS